MAGCEDMDTSRRQGLTLGEGKSRTGRNSPFLCGWAHEEADETPISFTSPPSFCRMSSKNSVLSHEAAPANSSHHHHQQQQQQQQQHQHQLHRRAATLHGKHEVTGGHHRDWSDGRVPASGGQERLDDDRKPCCEEWADTAGKASGHEDSHSTRLPALLKRCRNRRFHYTKKDGSRLNMLPEDERGSFYTAMIEVETIKMNAVLNAWKEAATLESANEPKDSIPLTAPVEANASPKMGQCLPERSCVVGEYEKCANEKIVFIERSPTRDETPADCSEWTSTSALVESFTSVSVVNFAGQSDSKSVYITSPRRSMGESDARGVVRADHGNAGRGEVPGHERSLGQMPVREMYERKMSEREMSGREMSGREITVHEIAGSDMTGKKMHLSPMTGRVTTEYEMTGSGTSGREMPWTQMIENGMNGHGESGREFPGHETNVSEMTGHELYGSQMARSRMAEIEMLSSRRRLGSESLDALDEHMVTLYRNVMVELTTKSTKFRKLRASYRGISPKSQARSSAVRTAVTWPMGNHPKSTAPGNPATGIETVEKADHLNHAFFPNNEPPRRPAPTTIDMQHGRELQPATRLTPLPAAGASLGNLACPGVLKDEDGNGIGSSWNPPEGNGGSESVFLQSPADVECSASPAPSPGDGRRHAAEEGFRTGSSVEGTTESRQSHDADNNCCDSYSSLGCCHAIDGLVVELRSKPDDAGGMANMSGHSADAKRGNQFFPPLTGRVAATCGESAKGTTAEEGTPVNTAHRVGGTGCMRQRTGPCDAGLADSARLGRTYVDGVVGGALASAVGNCWPSDDRYGPLYGQYGNMNDRYGCVDDRYEHSMSTREASGAHAEERHGKPPAPKDTMAGNESDVGILIKGGTSLNRNSILPRIPANRKVAGQRNVHFEVEEIEEEGDTMKSVSSLGSEKSQPTTCLVKSTSLSATAGNVPSSPCALPASPGPAKDGANCDAVQSPARPTRPSRNESSPRDNGEAGQGSAVGLSPSLSKRSNTFSLKSVVSKSVQVTNSNDVWADARTPVLDVLPLPTSRPSQAKRPRRQDRSSAPTTTTAPGLSGKNKKDCCEAPGSARAKIATAIRTRLPPLSRYRRSSNPISVNQVSTNQMSGKVQRAGSGPCANESQNKAEVSSVAVPARNGASKQGTSLSCHGHLTWETTPDELEMNGRSHVAQREKAINCWQDAKGKTTGSRPCVAWSGPTQVKATSLYSLHDNRIHINLQLEDVQTDVINKPLLLKIYTNGRKGKPLKLLTTPQERPRPHPPLVTPISPAQKPRGVFINRREKMNVTDILMTRANKPPFTF